MLSGGSKDGSESVYVVNFIEVFCFYIDVDVKEFGRLIVIIFVIVKFVGYLDFVFYVCCFNFVEFGFGEVVDLVESMFCFFDMVMVDKLVW